MLQTTLLPLEWRSLALAPLALILVLLGVACSAPEAPSTPAVVESASAPAQPAAPPPPQDSVIADELRSGESLGSALARHGIGPATVQVIVEQFAPLYDFRQAKPGHRYRLTRSPDGHLREFEYRISTTERFVLRPTAASQAAAAEGVAAEELWEVAHEAAQLEPQVVRLSGVVTSTLTQSIAALGESAALTNAFADIFAWDIDFTRGVQRGDEFHILYERLYAEDEQQEKVYVRPGRILAARYKGATLGEHAALYFEPEGGLPGDYFRPDGTSLKRQFLKAPLEFSRISSGFSNARRHPILAITRPHPGIDYAAPTGTPLWSVASGKVIYRGWQSGFGNLVKIQHDNGYVSYYGHLSRFASGLALGTRVQQKQVIGYVGATGLATGPHVCFRITRSGQFIDPAKLPSPAAECVPEHSEQAFEQARDSVLAELGVDLSDPSAPQSL